MIVLGLCWLLASGGGVWVTYFQQPSELERLRKAEQVENMKHAELSSLSAEIGATREQAEDVRTRWNSRYKVVPRELGSEEVVAFLNEHTESGFESLNVTFKQREENDDVNMYVFDISGRADFRKVYQLVWAIENGRQLYRIGDLSLSHTDLLRTDPVTGREEMKVLTSFTLELRAYFGGMAGLSAADSVDAAEDSGIIAQIDPEAGLPEVPSHVLPERYPSLNPFYPLILETVPPNTRNLVDLEDATLVSIVGGKAVFEWDDKFVSVEEGGSVYLGQLISVDPKRGRVVARLNKGGIIDEVELSLDTGDLYRQALGPAQLTPTQN